MCSREVLVCWISFMKWTIIIRRGTVKPEEKNYAIPPPQKNIRKYFSSPTPFAIIKTTSKIRFPPRDRSLFMWVGAGNKLGTFLKSEKGVFN